jgi:predicted TIM-barrel fold metal-dependent hydrolase
MQNQLERRLTNRMRFLVLPLIIFQFACANQGIRHESDDRELPFPVIDSHTHADFTNRPEPNSGILETKEQYLKELKEAGVVGAVSHNVDWSHDEKKEPRLPYQDLSAHHVIQCYGVGKKVDPETIEEGLKSKKFRCVKIYLGYIHRFAFDSEYKKVYRLAEKYDVPVVFHTGDTYSDKAKLKFSDPLTIDEVAVDFPKVNFVIAHCGNPWIQSAAEVAYKNSNVFLDGSAFLVGDLSKYSQETLDQSVVQPIRWILNYLDTSKKLMFGTDWPLVHVKDYLVVFKRAVPKEYWRDVFYENAVRVFKFKIEDKNAKSK